MVLPVVNSLPGNDNDGRLEDTSQALVDISQSPTLALLCALSFVTLALLNPLSMAIGLAHGSVLRVFMDVIRAAAVWVAELVMSSASAGKYGRGLNSWSWLQVLGFVLIAVGVVLSAEDRSSGGDGANAL